MSAPGRVRMARLTDLAAVGELSQLSHGGDGADEAAVRSLGLPVAGNPIGVFTLFRMPLGALRPQDQLYVYEDQRGLAGLLRAERDAQRDEWTIVELDAVGLADAGDIRFRLVQHLLRDGAKRGAMRFHVACADMGGNVELFMQAGFMRYGEEWVLLRPPDAALPAPIGEEQALSRHPAGGAARRPAAQPPVRDRDAPAGGPPGGLPPARLGAPGRSMAHPALVDGAHPALRRRQRVRPGLSARH